MGSGFCGLFSLDHNYLIDKETMNNISPWVQWPPFNQELAHNVVSLAGNVGNSVFTLASIYMEQLRKIGQLEEHAKSADLLRGHNTF